MRTRHSLRPHGVFIRRLRAFTRNRNASIAAITAGGMAMVIGVTALAVDVGHIYYSRRKAQTAVDFAAIAGAGSLPSYDAIVRANLADNGFSGSATPGDGFSGSATPGDGVIRLEQLVMTPGRYTPDPAIAIAARFQPSDAASANALRVSMRHATPIFFGKLLTGQSNYTFEVRGTAATATSATFSVGTRLARLDGGIANAILTALLGTSISLSVMDYEALATARIDLFPFLNLFGEEINLRAGTYDNLLEANGTVGKVFRAASRAAAAAGQTNAASALNRLASSTDVARLAIKLRDIISLGPQGSTGIGEGPAAAAQFDALSLLMAQAQVANKNRQVALNLAAGLPGIAGVTLTLGIGERPVHGIWMANGRAGAQVHTAQTRLLLDIRLLGGGILPAGIRLPVYVELANADARLVNVRCRVNPAQTRVEIDARPGIVDAWIGDVGVAQFNNFSQPLNPPAVPLVSLLGIAVTGRAHATMSNIAYERLSFTRDDIRTGRPQTVRTRDFTTSLVTRLVGDLQLQTSLVGIPLIDLTLLRNAVRMLTQNATPAIDTLLFNTLTLLGVSLGEADVWANGVRCDGGVLVN